MHTAVGRHWRRAWPTLCRGALFSAHRQGHGGLVFSVPGVAALAGAPLLLICAHRHAAGDNHWVRWHVRL